MAFDAFLIQSFGGPNKRADVIPFLEHVTRGRDIPQNRLRTVAEQYYLFDGKSPINEINYGIIRRLESAFSKAKISLPIYFGNRNFEPYLIDAVRQLKADGRTNVITFVTSAYGSFSGCKQYKIDLETACSAVEGSTPAFVKIRHFYSHPGFINPLVNNSLRALETLSNPERAKLVFTAHSIPLSQAENSPYQIQLQRAAEFVTRGIEQATERSYSYSLAYQSRSGPPTQKWLEPDVSDHLKQLSKQGVTDAVIIPVGFISDHLEVIYDLDILAATTAHEVGIEIARAKTPSDSSEFIDMIVDLTQEIMRGSSDPKSLGESFDLNGCTDTCCEMP